MRKACGVCGTSFETKRKTAKYCSDRCRKRAQRGGADAASRPASASPDAPPARVDAGADSLEAAARDELAAADRVATSAGRAVLALARRIDAGGQETGSAVAALVKEFRASMAEALKGAEQAADPLDELRVRRERKRTG